KGNAQSDLYGLGVVMYEALTGVLPFASDQPATAVFARLHRPVRPPRELRPEVPCALETVVLRCMAREARDRFASAEQLVASLRGIERVMGGGVGAASDAGAIVGPPAAPEPARAPRSVAADRLADRSGPTYLAVPPFESLDHDDQVNPTTAELAR